MKCLRTNISRLPVVAAAIAVTAMPALACGDNERVIVETRGPSIHAKAITVVMGGEDADHVIEVRVENGETTVIVNGEEIAPDRFRTENGNVIVFDEDGNEIQSVKLFMKAGDPGFILTMPGKEGLRWQFHRPHANVMLGVHLADPGAALRKHLRLEPGEGSMIRGLYEGLPAHRAGLQQYDVIIAVDGEPVDDSGTILAALAGAEAGDEVTLSVVQNGRHKQFTVTLDAFDAAKMGPANLIGGGGGGAILRQLGIPNLEFQFAPGEDFQFKRFLVDPEKKDLFVPDVHFRQWRSDNGELDGDPLEHLNEQMAELHKMIDRLVKEARQRER